MIDSSSDYKQDWTHIIYWNAGFQGKSEREGMDVDKNALLLEAYLNAYSHFGRFMYAMTEIFQVEPAAYADLSNPSCYSIGCILYMVLIVNKSLIQTWVYSMWGD